MKCGSGELINRREFLTLLAAAAASVPLTQMSAFGFGGDWHEREQPLMGTFVAIGLVHEDREAALGIISDTFDFINLRIKELSSWDPESVVSEISRSRCSLDLSCHSVRKLMLEAQAVERITAGKFKLLSGSLTDLWRSAAINQVLPDKIDLKHAILSIERSQIISKSPGFEISGNSAIDVGGIGKGLIADLAASYLESRAINQARVACSGDLRFVGSGPWNVEIEHPREKGILRTIQLPGALAISTSGDYRNNWQAGGVRQHHLIDPHTGSPGRENIQVTVIAPTGARADALASGLFFIPPPEAIKILNKLPGHSGVIVDRAGQVWMA